jgi:glycosyltransferase involved in cell wall biosynthesis
MRSHMAKPVYSIIIPTLNEEKFLPHLLASLTTQTVKNFEVIVVDSSPNQQTKNVAKRFYRKLPLTIIRCEKTGVSRQRNMGAARAKSDWFVFVDADSVFLSNFIERISRYIKRKHAKFFTTWFKADRDNPVYAIAGFIGNMTVESGILSNKPWAPGPLTIVQRKAFESVGGYNESVTYGEDHELGVAICKRGVPFTILREVLYIYSFRRFRKEGTLRILDRTMKSTLSVFLTQKGLKKIPGFVSGGAMYSEKKKKNAFFKKFEQNMRKIIHQFVME